MLRTGTAHALATGADRQNCPELLAVQTADSKKFQRLVVHGFRRQGFACGVPFQRHFFGVSHRFPESPRSSPEIVHPASFIFTAARRLGRGFALSRPTFVFVGVPAVLTLPVAFTRLPSIRLADPKPGCPRQLAAPNFGPGIFQGCK